MRSLTSRTMRRGGLFTLALTAPLVTVAALAPAQASPEAAAAVQDLGAVRVHTWAETPGSHHAAPHLPTGTWIDGVHGPVLDGVLLSTPMLVALLVTFAALAVVMANRAGRAARTATAPATGPALVGTPIGPTRTTPAPNEGR